jgi:SagB-type dehydrogenase family enzyme
VLCSPSGADRISAVKPLVSRITMPPQRRLRRSPWIVSYWDKGQLIYENFLNRVRISALPLCTTILDFFGRWRRPEELPAALPEFSPASVRRTLSQLTALSFLEEKGHADPRSRAMQAWQDWSPEASFFHFSTKDVPYAVSSEVERRTVRGFLRRSAQPPFFKRYPLAPAVVLPRARLPAESEFLRILFERRTWREFSGKKLPLETLSWLLYLTWGVTGYLHTDLLGRLPLKTSPSAGARHPTEVYVVPLRVEGLPQGLYHYASDRHQLECLRKAPMKRRAVRYLGGQDWFAEAAALFLMTAIFPRIQWRYKYARSYRSVLLDAGHLCQTLCLAATWLKLRPFSTAALGDSLIERDIGADGLTESVVYAAGVGHAP